MLALSTLFLITSSTFQMPLELDKAKELMYFQNIGKEVSATTDDDVGGNDESSTDESSNEEGSSLNFRTSTLEGKSITDLDLSNFKPFSELEVKNGNDESLSSNFIDPFNDVAPPRDNGNSNKSLSDLLEVESTTKTPSSSIDNQLVSRQFPNIESFGRDSNLGLGILTSRLNNKRRYRKARRSPTSSN